MITRRNRTQAIANYILYSFVLLLLGRPFAASQTKDARDQAWQELYKALTRSQVDSETRKAIIDIVASTSVQLANGTEGRQLFFVRSTAKGLDDLDSPSRLDLSPVLASAYQDACENHPVSFFTNPPPDAARVAKQNQEVIKLLENAMATIVLKGRPGTVRSQISIGLMDYRMGSYVSRYHETSDIYDGIMASRPLGARKFVIDTNTELRAYLTSVQPMSVKTADAMALIEVNKPHLRAPRLVAGSLQVELMRLTRPDFKGRMEQGFAAFPAIYDILAEDVAAEAGFYGDIGALKEAAYRVAAEATVNGARKVTPEEVSGILNQLRASPNSGEALSTLRSWLRESVDYQLTHAQAAGR